MEVHSDVKYTVNGGSEQTMSFNATETNTTANLAAALAAKLVSEGIVAASTDAEVTGNTVVAKTSAGAKSPDKYTFTFDSTVYPGYEVTASRTDAGADKVDGKGTVYATSTITVAANAYKLEANKSINIAANTLSALNGQVITINRGTYSANSLAEAIKTEIDRLNLTGIKVSVSGRVVTIVDESLTTTGDELEFESSGSKPNYGFDVQ